MSDLLYRLGYGEDIHRFKAGRKLVLCGMEIPCDEGLDGHSDADAAFHAVSDALLGALGLGDIGKYFPPSDPRYEGIASVEIVKKCLALIKEKGYVVNNVDLAILAEKPRLRPYEEAMKASLSSALEVDLDQVGIQFMTNEGLDAVGQGKAIRVTAIALLKKGETL